MTADWPKAKAQKLHDDAMEWAEDALRSERLGLAHAARDRHRKAYWSEIEAARLLPRGYEPSRAVLFRSAAWLAMKAGWSHLAREAAEAGLDGAVHGEIIAELNEVLAEAGQTRTDPHASDGQAQPAD